MKSPLNPTIGRIVRMHLSQKMADKYNHGINTAAAVVTKEPTDPDKDSCISVQVFMIEEIKALHWVPFAGRGEVKEDTWSWPPVPGSGGR